MKTNAKLLIFFTALSLSFSLSSISRAEDGVIEDKTPAQKEMQDPTVGNMDVETPSPDSKTTQETKQEKQEKVKKLVQEKVNDPS